MNIHIFNVCTLKKGSQLSRLVHQKDEVSSLRTTHCNVISMVRHSCNISGSNTQGVSQGIKYDHYCRELSEKVKILVWHHNCM